MQCVCPHNLKLPLQPVLRSNGMLYVESSAKTAVNVAAIFECVAEKLTAPKALPQSVGLPAQDGEPAGS
jgi:hypothetical protein